MERAEMIGLLMRNAEIVIDNYVFDATSEEKERLLGKERARLETKSDLELQNMVVINCG